MNGRGQEGSNTLDASKSAALSSARFCLALLVMAYHLSASIAPQSGLAAVEAFFCISGFLVTMIASGVYAGRPGAYLANRFLRIYPLYWACLLVALPIVLIFPGGHVLNPSWLLPSGVQQTTENIFVFGLMQSSPARLLPPAWSLHTELWFYLIIGLGTAGRPRLTIACALASVIASTLCVLNVVPIPFYGHPIGNAYAFFLGSLAWQLRDRVRLPAPSIVLVFLTCLFAVLALGPQIRGNMANVFAVPFVVPVLLVALLQTTARIPADLRRHFNTLGKISYPMFLLHWPVAMAVSGVLKIGIGPLLFAIASLVTIVVSATLHFAVERHLEYIRDAIRPRPTARPFFGRA